MSFNFTGAWEIFDADVCPDDTDLLVVINVADVDGIESKVYFNAVVKFRSDEGENGMFYDSATGEDLPNLVNQVYAYTELPTFDEFATDDSEEELVVAEESEEPIAGDLDSVDADDEDDEENDDDLVDALRDLTNAISDLADANESLADAMNKE